MHPQKPAVNGEAASTPGGVPPIGNAAARQAIRAARSLYVNRRHEVIVADRIARASTVLRAYLLGTGLRRVQIGLFLVELVDGDVHVTKCPSIDATQLRLWRLEREPTDLLSEP